MKNNLFLIFLLFKVKFLSNDNYAKPEIKDNLI